MCAMGTWHVRTPNYRGDAEMVLWLPPVPVVIGYRITQAVVNTQTVMQQAVDGDGDPTSDSLTITILDGADPVGGDTLALTVNEAAIDGIGRTPASDAETDSGTLSFTAGSDTLGDFAFTGVGGLVTTLDGVGVEGVGLALGVAVGGDEAEVAPS